MSKNPKQMKKAKLNPVYSFIQDGSGPKKRKE